jgi:hypothetical protein
VVSTGEKFKHRQIRDIVYEVVAVDEKKGIVVLRDSKTTGSRLVKVTFQDLQSKYEQH